MAGWAGYDKRSCMVVYPFLTFLSPVSIWMAFGITLAVLCFLIAVTSIQLIHVCEGERERERERERSIIEKTYLHPYLEHILISYGLPLNHILAAATCTASYPTLSAMHTGCMALLTGHVLKELPLIMLSQPLVGPGGLLWLLETSAGLSKHYYNSLVGGTYSCTCTHTCT